uniref:ferroxidase n=1 Tax=Timema monikensis TaxID=170555 RepID=A0A7R9E0K5_9NEOP|nr:unnamed protein product [Timema monikensis]
MDEDQVPVNHRNFQGMKSSYIFPPCRKEDTQRNENSSTDLRQELEPRTPRHQNTRQDKTVEFVRLTHQDRRSRGGTWTNKTHRQLQKRFEKTPQPEGASERSLSQVKPARYPDKDLVTPHRARPLQQPLPPLAREDHEQQLVENTQPQEQQPTALIDNTGQHPAALVDNTSQQPATPESWPLSGHGDSCVLLCTLEIIPLDPLSFDHICDDTLVSLCDYFEELIEDCSHLVSSDVTYGDGVLTVQFGHPYGTYVINRQTPNQQIWLSSPTSGPKRYDFINNQWIYRHDGVSLHELLTKEISKIVKDEVDFSQCMYSGIHKKEP